MTKTVAYFPLQCALNSGPVMSAALQALTEQGFKITADNYDADVAIIWSVLWSGRMAKNQQVYQHFRSRNRPVICIEIGALNRGHTWKIAVNNINAQGYYGHRENLDYTRPSKLGIKLKNNTQTWNRVLVAGQHAQSLQLEGIDQTTWLLEQIQQIPANKQIVVRPHPRCALDRNRFPRHVSWEMPKKLANTYDSFDMHWDFDAVINYNSGPGIQAVIAGVPVIVNSSSLAYNVVNREQWLVEICHTEYTVEEIKGGEWVKRIGLLN